MLREVSRRGTIAAAAEQLGYTPSAVSQQLSTAEKATGVSMLERVGRNVLLTDAGHELVGHADLVLEQLEKAQAAIERVQGQVAGTLGLGFIESIGATLLGPIMKRLAEYPDLKLRTLSVDAADPADLIRAGEIDVSFVIGTHDSPTEVPDGFARTMIHRDWFRLALPDSHPAALAAAVTMKTTTKTHPSRLTIDLATLEGNDFIAPLVSNSCGRGAIACLTEAGLDPDIVHRVPGYPTTLQMIAAGAGVAVIPDLGLQYVPDGVEIFDIKNPRHRTVELLYRSSSAQRPSVRTLIEIVQEVAQDMELDHYSE